MKTKTIATILSLALTAGLCQTAALTQAAAPKLSTKKLTIKAVLVYLPYAKTAFWCLVSICQNGNFHGYFYESMVR